MADLITYALWIYVIIVVFAFLCEYIDSALGGGYGTIIVPLLFLIFGVPSNILVPAVLFTEILTGFGSSILHHYAGNVHFSLKRENGKAKMPVLAKKLEGIENEQLEKIPPEAVHNSLRLRADNFLKSFKASDDLKVSSVLAIFGIIGGVVAALVAINISKTALNTYIGVLVALIGLFVLSRLKWKFSWWGISGIGLLAAFNKGMSGGGYGPLIAGGQIIVDRNPRQAVGSTSLAEAIVCVSSIIIYYVNPVHIPANINYWYLVAALTIGSMLSVPCAVLTVKYIPIKKLQPLVGIFTILLGIFILLKTWVPALS
jgi:uncharacterized membrane protein YfcA